MFWHDFFLGVGFIFLWEISKSVVRMLQYPYYWGCPVETCNFQMRADTKERRSAVKLDHMKAHGF